MTNNFEYLRLKLFLNDNKYQVIKIYSIWNVPRYFTHSESKISIIHITL